MTKPDSGRNGRSGVLEGSQRSSTSLIGRLRYFAGCLTLLVAFGSFMFVDALPVGAAPLSKVPDCGSYPLPSSGDTTPRTSATIAGFEAFMGHFVFIPGDHTLTIATSTPPPADGAIAHVEVDVTKSDGGEQLVALTPANVVGGISACTIKNLMIGSPIGVTLQAVDSAWDPIDSTYPQSGAVERIPRALPPAPPQKSILGRPAQQSVGHRIDSMSQVRSLTSAFRPSRNAPPCCRRPACRHLRRGNVRCRH
jgi:hypothetical protein